MVRGVGMAGSAGLEPRSLGVGAGCGGRGCGRARSVVGYRLVTVKLPRECTSGVMKFVREFRRRCWLQLYGERVGDGYRFLYVPKMAEELRSNVDQYLYQIRRGLRPKWYRHTAKSRTRPHYRLWPLLRIRFLESGRKNRGSVASPVVVNLSRSELRLRLPSGTIKVRLKSSEVGILREIAERADRVVAQLVCKHRPVLRVIGLRRLRIRVEEPFLVIAIDLNSKYGLVVRGLAVDEAVRLVVQRRFKPPSHARRWVHVRELMRLKMFREANRVLRRMQGVNRAWEETVVAELRRTAKSWREKGYSVIILVDKPEPETLRGTHLQCTLLRVMRRIKWMAAWDDVLFLEWKASGRLCPVCGSRGVERSGRVFTCPVCGAEWNRDVGACLNAVVSFLEHYVKRSDLAEIARRWLRERAEKNKESLRRL